MESVDCPLSPMRDREPEYRALLRGALLAYFRRHRRDFPWRRDRDPYRVLVSEIMLQQTRAASAIPYFERWLLRFPTIAALAEAGEEEVLKAWEGLGYYSRAANLHRAARDIVKRHGGRVPSDPDDLRALPGIGAYTAGAVASIAYGIPVGAVDGNARRVLSRLMDERSPTERALYRWATTLVDPTDPGSFNQALMELGSQICLPRNPRCEACPISNLCESKRSGTQEVTPQRRSRRAAPRLTMVCVGLVWRRGGRSVTLVRQRPSRGLLGGMWELPEREVRGPAAAAATAGQLARCLTDSPRWERVGHSAMSGPREDSLLRCGPPRRLRPVAHDFTHRRMTYIPFVVEVSEMGWLPGLEGRYRWASRDGARELPMGVAQLKILKQVI